MSTTELTLMMLFSFLGRYEYDHGRDGFGRFYMVIAVVVGIATIWGDTP